MEIIALIRPYRDKAGRHSEAMEVARHIAVHISQFMGIEIVACREREGPVWGRADIARETQVLRYPSVILKLIVIE